MHQSIHAARAREPLSRRENVGYSSCTWASWAGSFWAMLLGPVVGPGEPRVASPKDRIPRRRALSDVRQRDVGTLFGSFTPMPLGTRLLPCGQFFCQRPPPSGLQMGARSTEESPSRRPPLSAGLIVDRFGTGYSFMLVYLVLATPSLSRSLVAPLVLSAAGEAPRVTVPKPNSSGGGCPGRSQPTHRAIDHQASQPIRSHFTSTSRSTSRSRRSSRSSRAPVGKSCPRVPVGAPMHPRPALASTTRARHSLCCRGCRPAAGSGPARSRSTVTRSRRTARSPSRHGVDARPVPRIGPHVETGARGHHATARRRLPGAELFDHARPRVGARHPRRGRVSLRLEPISGEAARLRIRRGRARSARAASLERKPERDPAGHGRMGWSRAACRWWRVFPNPAVLARLVCTSSGRATGSAGNVLHPPMGGRSRAAALRRPADDATAALRRSRSNDSAAAATALDVPIRIHRRDYWRRGQRDARWAVA